MTASYYSLKNFLFKRAHKLNGLTDQVLVSGGNFLTIAICAHVLPLSEQGKFTYIFASYMALLLLNVAGIFQGAAVRAPVQDESYQVSLARFQLLQALMLSVIIFMVWFGVGNIFGWQASKIEAELLFLFLMLQQLADFDRRSAYVFSGSNRALCSSAMLYPLRIIGLLVIRPESIIQVLLILLVSALTPAVFTILTASRRLSENSLPWVTVIKDHLIYSRLFIAGIPLVWLWANIPVFLLGLLHGKEQAALLASIRGISNIANVLMEQIETKVVADWGRVRHGEGTQVLQAAVNRLLWIGALFWIFGMVVTLIFGRAIVALVLGNLYAPHWNLLVIGWLGYGIFFFARILSIKHRTLGANKVEFIGNFFGVLAALAAGVVIIPALNVTGAAWVYVIIAGVMLISQILVLKNTKLGKK